jgi:hypothetical protein
VTLYLGCEGFQELVEAQRGRARGICQQHGGTDLGRPRLLPFGMTATAPPSVFSRIACATCRTASSTPVPKPALTTSTSPSPPRAYCPIGSGP